MGCGAQATQNGSTSLALDLVEAAQLLPIDARLEELFGYSLSDLQLAVERARVEVLGSCLVEQGWEFEVYVPEPFDPTTAQRLTAAENAKQSIEESLKDEGANSTQPDAYYDDYSDCSSRAEKEIPDPTMEAWEWLATETTGLYDRVASDREVVEASAELTECMARTGYPATPDSESGNDFYAGSQEIVEAVNTGVLTPEEAYERLDVLNHEERDVWAATDPCTEGYLAVERRVASAAERDWLETEGSRLALMTQQLEGTIADLEGELETISQERE